VFRNIFKEVEDTFVIKNTFLVLAKISHECFKMNLYSTAECLIEFAINKIDTDSLRLKMATLSTLSACYWRLEKFTDSVNCIKFELKLAYYLQSLQKTEQAKLNFMQNIYRLYGNLASAYERLNNLNECLKSFESQLVLANELGDKEFLLKSMNSIGLVYYRLNNFEKAVQFFTNSLKIIDQISTKMDSFSLLKLKVKQLNLLGESYFKLGNFKAAIANLNDQLMLSDDLINNKSKRSINEIELGQMLVQQCVTMLNLAIIFTKLKNFKGSVEKYEKCLKCLKNNNEKLLLMDPKLTQQVIELNGRVLIGLINNYLYLKDTLKATLHSHALLDYTLKEADRLSEETSKLKEDGFGLNEQARLALMRRRRYLKFLEMSACSKLATCYAKQNRLKDAFKLHLREAKLANQLGNTLYITRAYSHIAQIYFQSSNYEKCIFLYKQILQKIETNLLIDKKEETDNEIENDLSEYVDQNCLLNNKPSDTSSSELATNDERIIQMIYFTLSNIGLCMEILEKVDDASLMFREQYEIANQLNNPKFKTNALLNLVNLYLNKLKFSGEQQDHLGAYIGLSADSKTNYQMELTKALNQLIELYQKTDDCNGLLFATQCLAYIYHTNGHVKKAIEIYLMNIEICRSLGQSDYLIKSLFNLSLCFKMMRKYEDSYKYQLEYLNAISNLEKNQLDKFVSLGILADLSLEIDKSNANCQSCIQIQIDRLKIIKSTSKIDKEALFDERNDTKQTINFLTNENRHKLINECLESIAKCYDLMENYLEVLRFKLIQLKLTEEMLTESDLVNKKKAKIWLDIGNLFLFKLDDVQEASKYFQMIEALNNNDLLLQSLMLGNLGLCEQKLGNYQEALKLFERQLNVLDQKLQLIDEKSVLSSLKSCVVKNDLDGNNFLKYSFMNIEKIKEIISIRIDIGRTYAKLGKSNELLSQSCSSRNDAKFYLHEAIKFYSEYSNECEYLFKSYVELYLANKRVQVNKDEDKETLEEIDQLLNDLCEQIYIDYDTSLAKLASFHFTYNLLNSSMQISIDLNEKRLEVLDRCSELSLGAEFKLSLGVQINFMLANFYAKFEKHSKSLLHCKNVLFIFENQQLVTNEPNDNIFLIETLNLLCDMLIMNQSSSKYRECLNYALRSYELVWRLDDVNCNPHLLQLKYETTVRVCRFYRDMNMLKECIELLVTALASFGKEFQQLHRIHKNETSNDQVTTICLVQYIEFVFLMHRKVALIHMKHSLEANLSSELREKGFLLSLKHCNEALTYLKYQKEAQYLDSISSALLKEIVDLRQASVYFMLGKCHKYLNNNEMELEMFANSLDLYENMIAQNNYDNETLLKDRLISSSFHQALSSSFEVNKLSSNERSRYDEDEETIINYLERVDHLYQHIEDVLIRMGKYKETILVCERHRCKLYPQLNCLPELVNFDQVNNILSQSSTDFVLYFNRSEVNCTLNCWLLKSNSNLQFHQIACKSFESLLDTKCADLTNELLNFDEHEQSTLLHQIYNIILKPFEAILFKNYEPNRPKHTMCIVYDETLFKIPFHQLRMKIPFNQTKNSEKCIYELFELDCVYSLKYLIKPSKYNSKYTKLKLLNSSQYNEPKIPMKIVSNRNELNSLIKNPDYTMNAYQYDLVLLRVEHLGKSYTFYSILIYIKLCYNFLLFDLDKMPLNSVVNLLMSKKITKSVLIDLTANKESHENEIKNFLKTLYDHILNSTALRVLKLFSYILYFLFIIDISFVA
jgi:tetratricopeptide (TPR) repeat protein